VVHVPTAALSTEALPTAPIPAVTALTESRTGMSLQLEFRPQGLALYLIVTGLKPLRTGRRQPPAEIPATRKVRHRREPCIDVSSSLSLPVIWKPERT
jgi:hypothetical protein